MQMRHNMVRLMMVPFLALIGGSPPFLRFKRDFMFVPDDDKDTSNGTSNVDCYQQCNDVWNGDFRATFNMSSEDFYDFPLHPLILNESDYEKYCAISLQRVRCYSDECGDTMADRVWSPANYLCSFAFAAFKQSRHCLLLTEPLSFDLCEGNCHGKAVEAVKNKGGGSSSIVGRVFTDGKEKAYRDELDTLCTFQQCFKSCQNKIILSECDQQSAKFAIELIDTYVEWHADDVGEWHDNVQKQLPKSCSDLRSKNSEKARNRRNVDPVFKIFTSS